MSSEEQTFGKAASVSGGMRSMRERRWSLKRYTTAERMRAMAESAVMRGVSDSFVIRRRAAVKAERGVSETGSWSCECEPHEDEHAV